MGYDIVRMRADGLDDDTISQITGFDINQMKVDGLDEEAITQIVSTPSEPLQPNSQPNLNDVLNEEVPVPLPKEILDNEEAQMPNEQDEEIPRVDIFKQEDRTGAFRENVTEPLLEGAGQTLAGVRQPILGAAKVVNDLAQKIGLPEDKKLTSNINELETYVSDYNKQHPDQIIHPSTVGQIATFALAGGETALSAATQVGSLEFLGKLGSNESYEDSAKDAVVAAVLTGASVKVLDRVFPKYGTITREGKIILKLNQGRLSEEQALKQLKDIPPEDQAMALSMSIDLMKNYFKTAVGDDSILASKLGSMLEQQKNVMHPFTANEMDVIQAQKTFGEMKARVDKEAPSLLDAEPLLKEVDKVAQHYKTDASPLSSSINNVLFDLQGTEGKLTAGQVLDIRENINALLRKPAVKKVYKTRTTLGKVKNELDSWLNTNLSQDLTKDITGQLSKYSETMNRKKLGDIIEKNSKSDYAVNWTNVVSDVEKEGLSPKVKTQVVPILKELEKKFHNSKYLGEVISPAANHDNLNALGVTSKVILTVLDTLNSVTFGVFAKSRYKDNLIKKALIKSIKKAETNLDFVEGLVGKESLLPKEAQEVIKPTVNKLKPELEALPEVGQHADLKPLIDYVRVVKEGDLSKIPTEHYKGTLYRFNRKRHLAKSDDIHSLKVGDSMSLKHPLSTSESEEFINSEIAKNKSKPGSNYKSKAVFTMNGKVINVQKLLPNLYPHQKEFILPVGTRIKLISKEGDLYHYEVSKE